MNPSTLTEVKSFGLTYSWLSVLLVGVSIPEKPKLRFVERAPLVPKVRREPKNLRDIRGPSTEATEFTEGTFAILVSSASHGYRTEARDQDRLLGFLLVSSSTAFTRTATSSSLN